MIAEGMVVVRGGVTHERSQKYVARGGHMVALSLIKLSTDLELHPIQKISKKQVDRNLEENLLKNWALDNFQLRDNPIIKDNPELGEQLMEVI